MLGAARQRAKKGGIEFTISEADIEAVWPADGKCPALGVDFAEGADVLEDCSPSLDRIDPRKGYVPGNIAVISYVANAAKRDLTREELERIVSWLKSQERS